MGHLVSPIVTGFIVLETGSFSSAFIVAAVVLLVGIVSYVFVLGRIEPLPDLDAQAPLRAGHAPAPSLGHR